MQISRTQLGLLLALLISNTIILFSRSPSLDGLRFWAAVSMTFVLPGWAWLPGLGWLRTRQVIERIVLIIGFSSLLSALVLLITLFLPGPFTETPVLIALNLITLAGLLGQFSPYRRSKNSGRQQGRREPAGPLEWPSRTVLLILLAILAGAALTRLTQIGYAEFHEDELENMRLIVRAYKGEEYAPFLDSKGPIHWLLPAALWYLNGWGAEGLARTPFAVAALALIPLMYVLGKRMSGGRDRIGLIAAGFVAVNGFYVAYARYVENQSLIVFWGALAMWLAYRFYKEEIDSFLLYVALTLAVGLIAHPDVLLYLPAFAFIIGLSLWRDRRSWRRWLPWLMGAGLLFSGLVAMFYLAYFLDPKIGLIYQYYAGDRLGESLLYNRVGNLFDQDRLYSSRYHAPVLALLLAWLLARRFARWRPWGRLVFSGLSAAIVSTVIWPTAWLGGNLNLAFGPYALLTLIFLLLPGVKLETKLIFVWFSAPLGALLFLAKDAADHVQIAYTAWALLAATALVDLWAFLGRPSGQAATRAAPARSGAPGLGFSLQPLLSPRTVRRGLIVALAGVIGLILFYQYLVFLAPVTTYRQVKRDSAARPASIYNILYGSMPRPRKLFSNPRLSGWKAVGYLWETGRLSGDFRSINESFATPIWYTFQTPRSCYEDPQNYWVRRSWDGWPEEEQTIIEQGYTLTRIVQVEQEPMLHLYEKNVAAAAPEIIDMAAYRDEFDRLAVPARFAREETGAYQTMFDFGDDRLRLTGYDLSQSVAQPGDRLPVTVYWEAFAPMTTRYRAFMHLIDADGALWGQHDDDPACRLLTTDMRPGQRSARRFRLPIDPATPPGEYTIRFGLYDPASLERLAIWDAQTAQPAGDSLILGRVNIAPPGRE